MIDKTITRPALRYHGAKWMLAPWIVEHFPKHEIYVEPYGGAASILLRKKRVYAEIYNDLDADIVNFFEVARDRGPDLKKALELTPFSRKEFELSYQYTDDNFEAARRTCLRAFAGFGSAAATKTTYGESSKGFRTKGNYSGDYGKPCTGFRSSSNRSGTTPAMDWRNYPNAFDAIIERLQGVVIECRDALEVMDQHDTPNTLHYVDPPYMKETRHRGSNTQEYRHEMNDQDHQELLRFLRQLQGYVVLSGYANDLYDNALGDWYRVTRSAFADGAKKRVEVLWISPNTPVQKQMKINYD